MNIDTVARPDLSEFAEYFGLYIDRVPQGNITDMMLGQIDEFKHVLGGISDEQASVIHEPYSWTIKQVVGHLIDVEKVFGYRGHRFACNDLRPILGMEQNDFVENLDYDLSRLSDMAIELQCTRRSNTLFFKRLPAKAWDRQGAADGNAISVRAIAYILVGHVTHHLEIIKQRVA
jgi:hypothetical protein